MIDPFLQYGDLETIGDVQGFHQEPEGILASDRAFHNAIFDGDFWTTEVKR